MDFVSSLPAVNASLNLVAFSLLVLGYRQVKSGQVEKHKKTMLCALVASALFLVSYLTYHSLGEEKHFAGEGVIRYIYFFILITHIPLAAIMVPPILILAHAGIKDKIDRHRKLARFVLPVWMYVSVTGVLIYVLLHVLYPK
ncbi:MAG: putative membrane protein [Planctomycetota bacterium]|jgi:putative membrane protein